MNKKNNFVFGWFRPRARNLKQNIFYQKRKRGNDCQKRKTNFCILPVCDIISRGPLYVVWGNCLGGKGKFSILWIWEHEDGGGLLSWDSKRRWQNVLTEDSAWDRGLFDDTGATAAGQSYSMARFVHRGKPGQLGFDVVQLRLRAFNGHLDWSY